MLAIHVEPGTAKKRLRISIMPQAIDD